MTSFSEDLTEQNSANKELKISQLAEVYISEISKWGYFLSIVGFVMTGIVVILAIVFMVSTPFAAFSTSPLGRIPAGLSFITALVYIGFAALYFFPCLYLFRSSKAFKAALAMQDEHHITKAFENQKSLFKFMAFFTIAALAVYAVMIGIGIMGLLFAG